MGKSNHDRWMESTSRPEHGWTAERVAPARGAAKRWKNRAGVTVEVLIAEDEGLDADGLPWIACCVDHGSLVAVPTKASGIECCRDTTQFCDQCREAAKN